MNDLSRWIYFDGREPDDVKAFLDSARDLPPATADDKKRVGSAIRERLDAMLARRSAEQDDTAASAPAPSERIDNLGDKSASRLVDPPPLAQPATAPAAPSAPQPIPVTAVSPELPPEVRAQMGTQPSQATSPQPPAPENGAARPSNAQVMGFGDTKPSGDNTLAAIVAAVSSPGSAAGEETVDIPNLTAQQYASLCAELADCAPWESVEILRKYGVPDLVTRFALDRHWKQQLAAPEARAAFEADLAAFKDYLRAQRR